MQELTATPIEQPKIVKWAQYASNMIPKLLPVRSTSTAMVKVETPITPDHHVSVIIPAYNEEETIGAVLQSLLDQTRPPDTVHVIANNCFGMNEQYITRNGIRSFTDTVGTEQEVLTSKGWRVASIKEFGEQQVNRVVLAPARKQVHWKTGRSFYNRSTTKYRKTVEVTADHRWITSRGVVTDLRVGDVIPSQVPLYNPKTDDYVEGMRHGIIFGDGILEKNRVREGRFPHRVELFGKKGELSKWFDDVRFIPSVKKRIPSYKNTACLITTESLKELPGEGKSTDYIAGFIHGYIATDGSVEKRGGACSISSATEKNIRWVEERAPLAGFVVTGVRSATAISGYTGEPHTQHSINLQDPSLVAWKVMSIEESSVQRVACAVVPDLHEFTLAAGILTGNCSDETVYEASKLEGIHQVKRRLGLMQTNVVVHDIGKNPDKKVGALNHGYRLAKAEGAEFIVGVDGDTTLDRKCVEFLLEEMVGDSRIGGLSAIYSFENVKTGPVAGFLLSAQKAQFAAFNMDHLLKNRTMSVLGGQCSIFRVKTLDMLCQQYHQETPWVNDSEVEDSLLSIQIRTVGFQTKISAKARAYVGPMLNLRALYAQQIKWTAGGIKLMKQHPFHPNLRKKWEENFSMVSNIVVRLMFILLLAGSLSIGAFEFNPIWLIPPVLAFILSVRVTASMHNKTWKDWLYSLLFFPSEIYMWLRSTYFLASWWQVLNAVEKDNWGAQSAAESGKGASGLVWPVVALAAVFGISSYSWTVLTPQEQSNILAWGWPILMLFTVCLTLGMMKKALRRHRGFAV